MIAGIAVNRKSKKLTTDNTDHTDLHGTKKFNWTREDRGIARDLVIWRSEKAKAYR